MNILQPLGLLGLIGVPIIIIIYLIKSKYVQKPVSSTFIWKRSLKYIKRKVPMSIIISLLLILQLLTVIAASLAISRPTIKPLKSNETIIILDASASMQTTNGTSTRFQVAKDKIFEDVEKIGSSSSKVSLIVAGITAHREFEREENKVNIMNELESIKCSYGDADLEGAFELASEILQKNAGAKIKLYTDKDYAVAEDVEVINVARNSEKNVAILSAEEKRQLDGSYEFYVTIGAFGEANQTVVSIAIDGTVLKISEMITLADCSVEGNQPVDIVFTPDYTKKSDANTIYVTIDRIEKYDEAKFELGASDSLAEDNKFYVYAKEEANPKIMFISSNFKTTDSGAVDMTKPTSLFVALSSNGYFINSQDMHVSTEGLTFKGYDLYIFEGVEPPAKEEFPTDGAVWILNPPSIPKDESGSPVIPVEIVEDGAFEGDDKMFLASDSLSLTYTTITQSLDKNMTVGVGRYNTMVVSGDFEKIYSYTNNSPALLAGTHGGVRMVITSFDFRASSWAMKVTDYILLIDNLVKYSIPEVLTARDFTVGEKLQFNAPAGTEKIVIKYGDTVIDTIEDISATFELDKVGVYEIVAEFAEKDPKSYMVPTHIAANESNIEEAGDKIVAPQVPEGTEVEAEPIELFPYLIAFLILLLVLEWGVYHRDGF